jgi:hypothetical protein
MTRLMQALTTTLRQRHYRPQKKHQREQMPEQQEREELSAS